MAEIVGTLAFLITLDVALAVTLLLGHRVTAASYLKCGYYMMCFETSRQVLSAVISAWPEVNLLQLASSALDFGCALFMYSAVLGTMGRPLTRRRAGLATGIYAASILVIVSVPMHIVAVWLIANIVPVGLHVLMIGLLIREAPRRSVAKTWLTGLVVISMLFRLVMPFAIAASDSLFGLTYLLDSVVIAIIAATLGLLAAEGLANRYKAQKDIEQRNTEMIQTILNVAYDAIVGTDADGRITVWNDAAVRTFGWPLEDALGKYIDDVLPGFARTPSIMGTPERIETQCRSGALHTVDVTTFSADRRSGPIIVRIVRDITAQLQAQSELRTLELQMQQVRRLESLGEFAGGVAHDYNNILAAIINFAELGLAESPPASNLGSNLQEIVSAAERGSDLTRKILEYAGHAPTHHARLNVRREIESMLTLLRSVVSKKAIIETRDIPEDLEIWADRPQFGQVLLNLVTNASDALPPEGGTIHVGAAMRPTPDAEWRGFLFGPQLSPGPHVMLEVSDTGCGVEPDQIERIFEPFYTTKLSGRGLGMATVSAIVRAHRGAIEVTSEVGRGTTVRVVFPVAAQEGAGAPSSVAASSNGDRVATAADGQTVLVVDDEDAVRRSVSLILERAGYAVLTATDGRECLDVLGRSNGEVRLVILDCNMPRMSGDEALGEIMRTNAAMAVLMSSGKGQPQHAHADRANVQFIQKPYRASDLVERVRSMIQN